MLFIVPQLNTWHLHLRHARTDCLPTMHKKTQDTSLLLLYLALARCHFAKGQKCLRMLRELYELFPAQPCANTGTSCCLC